MNALTLENVSYTYPGGTAPVVKNASYEFESGKLRASPGTNPSRAMRTRRSCSGT